MSDGIGMRVLTEIGIVGQRSTTILESLMPYDLTLAQYNAMDQLAHDQENASPGSVAVAARVTRATMTSPLHRLKTKGFVVFQVGTGDRRFKRVVLTDLGYAAFLEASHATAQCLTALRMHVGIEELEAILSVLTKLQTFLENPDRHTRSSDWNVPLQSSPL
jgi:DNA-binding MarR family transcriptional regulator